MEFLTARDLLTVILIAAIYLAWIVGAHLLAWPWEADARRAPRDAGGTQNPLALPIRYGIGVGLHGICFSVGVLGLEGLNPVSVLILYWTTWTPGGLAIVLLHAGRGWAENLAARARAAGGLREILHGGAHGTSPRDAGD